MIQGAYQSFLITAPNIPDSFSIHHVSLKHTPPLTSIPAIKAPSNTMRIESLDQSARKLDVSLSNAIIISNDDGAYSHTRWITDSLGAWRKPGRLIRRNDKGLEVRCHQADWTPTAFRNTWKPIGHWNPVEATSHGEDRVTTDGLRRQACRRS